MTFQPKKFNEIFEDMRQRSTLITDFEVGSVARTLVESFAFEMALMYEKMHLVYLAGYVDTAQGQQLDMVVSILGLKRGLPDFATGVVTFERDVGNEDIEIPLATLIATEESPESPKKVYQTSEAKTLLRDHTSVEVKVQALERGEEEVTPAETIVVMPRPIPGIKAVVNAEATRFTGKQRETDEELRERAKNALISSGKAALVSVENALLSLPRVKDVKVKENFHFARGKVTLERASGSAAIVVPRGTSLNANTGQRCETTERVALAEGEASVDVAVQSLLRGQAGEVTTKTVWEIAGNAGLKTLTARNTNPILLGDFGIIEIFVDGIDLEQEPTEVERIWEEIERVRAAGIFVLLKSTLTVHVDGVFRVTFNPELKLSAEERAAFETSVADQIETYVSELKMGHPLLFGQISKRVLSLDGLNDVEDFTVTTHKTIEGDETSLTFAATDKRINVQEFEKFKPRYICVASETKQLPVDIQFHGDNLDAERQSVLAAALATYFDGLKVGDLVELTEVQGVISGAGINLVGDTLVLTPRPWCERAPGAGPDVEASFVEQPILGVLFGYRSRLQITGALKLTLPTIMTGLERDAVAQVVRQRVTSYLNNLGAEADVVFEDLSAIAAGVDRVLAADLDWRDFRVEKEGAELPGRVTETKIAVAAFEKAVLTHFCLTSGVESITIAVQTLTIDLLIPDPAPSADQINATKDSIKQAVKNTVDNFLSEAEPGDDVNYSVLRSALENLVPGANYNVVQLVVTAISACDDRSQESNVATKNLHVRSVEIPVMQPIGPDKITINEVRS